MQHSAKSKVIGLILLSLLVAHAVFAAAPEPKSEGKFFSSKGTKSDENYQGRAAGFLNYQLGRGINIGDLLIKPIVAYVHEWASNIFFEENGRKEDHMDRLNAGFGAELPLNGAQHLLSFKYMSMMEWFERYDQENHDDHSFRGQLDLNFVPFNLELDNTFQKTVDRSDTEFTDRIKRDENTAHVLLEVPFAAFFLESEFFDFDIDYDDSTNSIFDHNEMSVYQRVGLDLGPSTQLLAEYGYTLIDYDHGDDVNGRDGDAQQVMLGVRGNRGSRISYQFWSGGQWRIYDLSSRPDYNGLIFRSALQYDISETSNIVLKGSRLTQESTFDDQSFYVRNRLEIGWRQQIADHLFFNSHELLDYNEYSRITVRNNTERTRRDYVWESAAGLEYIFAQDFASLFCQYAYQARESNTSGLAYDSQSITAGIKSKF